MAALGSEDWCNPSHGCSAGSVPGARGTDSRLPRDQLLEACAACAPAGRGLATRGRVTARRWASQTLAEAARSAPGAPRTGGWSAAAARSARRARETYQLRATGGGTDSQQVWQRGQCEGSIAVTTRDRFREGRVSIRPLEGRIYCCLPGLKIETRR